MKGKTHLVCWLLLAACVGIGPAEAAEHAPSADAATTVVKLYRDYAWEAVIDEPGADGQDLFSQPASVLGRYFSPSLIALILRDRDCQQRTHELCRLDYAPLWDSQDPGATELKISQTKDPAKVAVDFTYPGDSEHMHIVYVLERTHDGWRITDIQGKSAGLRKVLQEPMP